MLPPELYFTRHEPHINRSLLNLCLTDSFCSKIAVPWVVSSEEWQFIRAVRAAYTRIGDNNSIPERECLNMSSRKRNEQSTPNIIINDSEVRINSDNYTVPKQDTSTQPSNAKVLLSILLAFCTISGITGVSIWNYLKNRGQDDAQLSTTTNVYTEPLETETTFETTPNINYEVYLKPDYNRTSVNTPLDISVETTFDATSVSLTAHLNSGKTDVLYMNKIGENKWELKVQFYEAGVHEIIAAATIDDEIIESLPISITVDDFGIDDDVQNQISDFFEMLY